MIVLRKWSILEQKKVLIQIFAAKERIFLATKSSSKHVVNLEFHQCKSMPRGNIILLGQNHKFVHIIHIPVATRKYISFYMCT